MGRTTYVPPSILIILDKVEEIRTQPTYTEGERDAQKAQIKVLEEVLAEVKEL